MKYLTRNIDQERFNRLITLVKEGNVSSFVGAGLSLPKGYRTWKEVILGTKKGKKISIEGLVQSVGINLNDYSNKQLEDLYQIAQDCKESNPDTYEKYILAEFDRKKNLRNWDQTHYYIWKIPFISVLTTNFDPCLYDAAFEVLNKNPIVYTTGGFDIPLKKGNLYHLHGIATKTNPPINNIKTIILSKSEYFKAYSKNGALYRFLIYLFQHNHLLFMGFSFKDKFFEKLIEEILGILDEERRVAEVVHQTEFYLKEHYLLIRKDEINSHKEKRLKEYNIHTIKFEGAGQDYSSLLNSLIELYEKVTNTRLPKPFIQKPF